MMACTIFSSLLSLVHTRVKKRGASHGSFILAAQASRVAKKTAQEIFGTSQFTLEIFLRRAMFSCTAFSFGSTRKSFSCQKNCVEPCSVNFAAQG